MFIAEQSLYLLWLHLDFYLRNAVIYAQENRNAINESYMGKQEGAKNKGNNYLSGGRKAISSWQEIARKAGRKGITSWQEQEMKAGGERASIFRRNKK